MLPSLMRMRWVTVVIPALDWVVVKRDLVSVVDGDGHFILWGRKSYSVPNGGLFLVFQNADLRLLLSASMNGWVLFHVGNLKKKKNRWAFLTDILCCVTITCIHSSITFLHYVLHFICETNGSDLQIKRRFPTSEKLSLRLISDGLVGNKASGVMESCLFPSFPFRESVYIF